MKGKKELFLLVLGLGLFIFDMVSDCYVAYQYKRTDKDTWFGWTLVFIIVPHYVITLMAMYQMKDGFKLKIDCVLGLFYALFFFIFARFKEEFNQWKRTFLDNSPCEEYDYKCSCPQCTQHRVALSECRKSAYRFAWIRYVEVYLESTPQLCLQVYIMLNNWSFPWYTVLSATVALLSLAFGHTALEKARLANDGHDFSKKATFLYFVSQLFVLTPRLFAIIIFMHVTSAFGALVFIVISWGIGSFILGCVTCCHALSAVCCGDTRCDCSFIKTLCKKLTLSLLLSFYVSETVLESLGFSSIFLKIFFLLERSAENGVLIFFVMLAGNFPYQREFVSIAWSVFGMGFFFGTLLLIIRYTQKRRQETVDNANATEAEIPESSSKSATNRAFHEV